MTTASRMLQAYLSALTARDLSAIEKISAAGSLMEIPFIKPNRLVGSSEIVKAHREMFANLAQIDFELLDSNADNQHAIGHGRLNYVRNGGDRKSLPAAIVIQAAGDSLARMSLYCDARNLRPWSDKSIM